MIRSHVLIKVFLLSGIFFSCTKIVDLQHAGDAQWIQVVTDSSVTYTGKIRADASDNLYCSYNYKDEKISDSSGILKLDANGNLVWRIQYDAISIFDFLVLTSGQIIIASSKDSTVTIYSVPTDSGATTKIGSTQLPIVGKPISGVSAMKIFESDGGYNLSGTISLDPKKSKIISAAGFQMQITNSVDDVWKHAYYFSNADTVHTATSITGCAKKSDGYLLFGNCQDVFPAVSRFFVMNCNSTGDSLYTTFYPTSTYDADADTFGGYYCGTSDILKSGENYFGCAFNVLYNTAGQVPVPVYNNDDNSARVFKFDANGNISSRDSFKFDFQNQVADFIVKDDGGLLIGLNPNKLGNFSIVGKRNSFVANLDANLKLQSAQYLQTQFTDYLGALCKMKNGYAVESMIQSFGKEHYRLEIIKTDENGNF